MNQKWHWSKNKDFPKEDMEVYCVVPDAFRGECHYITIIYHYTVNYKKHYVSLCRESEKCHKQKGFYYIDEDYGPMEVADEKIVCWCKVPKLPSLPKEFETLRVKECVKFR